MSVSHTEAVTNAGHPSGQRHLRSASRPAPGLVASKSPPSAARPELFTYCSPVPSPLLWAPGPSSSAPPAAEESLPAEPASPPCDLATSSMGLGPAPSSLVGFSEVSSPPVLSTFLRSASFLGSAVAESGSLISAWGALKPVSPVVDGWSAVGPLAATPVESLLPLVVASVELMVGSPDVVLSLPVWVVLGAVEAVVPVAPDSARTRSAQPKLGPVRREWRAW